MFHDARSLPAGTVLEGDICIVGAGAAGITLARVLGARGVRVVLLESGGMELEEPTQALYAGEQRGVKQLDLDASRLRYFGGTTNHWAGLFPAARPPGFPPRRSRRHPPLVDHPRRPGALLHGGAGGAGTAA